MIIKIYDLIIFDNYKKLFATNLEIRLPID